MLDRQLGAFLIEHCTENTPSIMIFAHQVLLLFLFSASSRRGAAVFFSRAD